MVTESTVAYYSNKNYYYSSTSMEIEDTPEGKNPEDYNELFSNLMQPFLINNK
jgi:hypothetical protein